jgi:hypothetical protein
MWRSLRLELGADADLVRAVVEAGERPELADADRRGPGLRRRPRDRGAAARPHRAARREALARQELPPLRRAAGGPLPRRRRSLHLLPPSARGQPLRGLLRPRGPAAAAGPAALPAALPRDRAGGPGDDAAVRRGRRRPGGRALSPTRGRAGGRARRRRGPPGRRDRRRRRRGRARVGRAGWSPVTPTCCARSATCARA